MDAKERRGPEQPFAVAARQSLRAPDEAMDEHGAVYLLGAALCASAAFACGGGGSAPCVSPPAIAGDWSGTIANDEAGGGRLEISFDQSACALGGTWRAQYADPANDGSGGVQGTADGSDISFDLLTPVAGACGYRATASLDGPDEMTGQFSTVGLHCTASGSFNILRQSTPSPTAPAMAMPTATPAPSPTPTPIP
jgi:hypothetical protein